MIKEKLEKIKNQELSAKENVENFLAKIEEKDDEINAFIEINKKAVEEAKKVDEEIKKGRNLKLAGLVFAIKSNINVKGLRATCASKTLENYVSTYDATVIERLKKEGAIIIGMTNMDEFACGSSGETSYFGPTLNPRAKERIPGGSSSGSAAAVAGEMCDIALGSDTGGSIRNPASHCGVFGLKPTYGLVSRYGLIDLAMSLDQIGPISSDVYGVAVALEVIGGYDVRDNTTLKYKPKYELNGVENYTIAYAKEFEEICDKRIYSEFLKGLRILENKGAKIVEISLPNLEKGLPAYYLINFVEFFSATRKFDGRRYGYRIEEVCGKEVLRRILLGKYISQKEYSGKYYKKALRFRNLIREEILKALSNVDLIASPVTPKLPHKLGEEIEPLEMYKYDILTVIANLAGIPAGVAPLSKINNIPVGIQFQAKPLEEQKIINAMHAVGEEK